MLHDRTRPFLSRLDAADGRVPYEVLARWCRQRKEYPGEISPSSYDVMLDHYQAAHIRLSQTELLHESVLENIGNILNATQLTDNALVEAGLSDDSRVGSSVLNFGIPTYVGGYGGRVYTREFSEGIRRSIMLYETRLVPESINVIVKTDNEQEPLVGEIIFMIEGDIIGLDSGNHMELETKVSPFKTPEFNRELKIFS